MTAASAIVTTSGWTTAQVEARYGHRASAVAGGECSRLRSHPARPGRTPRLLWLGRLTRTKDPLTLAQALSRLDDLDWTAQVVGPQLIDPDYTHLIRDSIERAGLSGRVELPGSRTGADLGTRWDASDLLVLTSRVEPYGMVVTEALARGIPSVVTAGTGAVEAQQVGATFPPGDASALVSVLRAWLTEPELRQAWRDAAVRQRAHLLTWDETAASVLAALEVSEPG